MPGLPPEVEDLLQARGPVDRDEAWARFVFRYSLLLIHTARKVAFDRDRAMDCYVHVLERLREEDCRRLRRYEPQPGSRFSTWLVVVTRRLCLDTLRGEYGRHRSGDGAEPEVRTTRRRLVQLIAVDLEKAGPLPDPAGTPDELSIRGELSAALQQAIDALPEDERLLLTLRFEDDRPAREIAQLMHLPTPFHVYRALRAVLNRLKRSLAAHGFHES